MLVRKSDIKILSSYVARVSSENRPLVEQTIELYKDRKISKFATAQNIISNLATKNKKKIDEAQKLLNKYSDGLPVTGIIQRQQEKIKENVNKRIVAANKITTKYRNRLVLEVSKKNHHLNDIYRM